MYRYDAEGGYSDLAEVARYECYDGCDIALLRCQSGYYCDWPSTIVSGTLPFHVVIAYTLIVVGTVIIIKRSVFLILFFCMVMSRE